jgi:hypothetical protein
MEEAFEEGQGPHRTVEPVIMMNLRLKVRDFRYFRIILRRKYLKHEVKYVLKSDDSCVTLSTFVKPKRFERIYKVDFFFQSCLS